jgi:hypothetical protein
MGWCSAAQEAEEAPLPLPDMNASSPRISTAEVIYASIRGGWPARSQPKRTRHDLGPELRLRAQPPRLLLVDLQPQRHVLVRARETLVERRVKVGLHRRQQPRVRREALRVTASE